MPKRQQDLDEARDARGVGCVPDVRLDGPDRAEPQAAGRTAERGGQRLEFDGVSQPRARAMCLHITKGLRRDAVALVDLRFEFLL